MFTEGESFHHGLFELEPVEWYMRILVPVMLVVFGIYAAFMLDRAERRERELRNRNDELVLLKAERESLVVVDPLTGRLTAENSIRFWIGRYPMRRDMSIGLCC